MKLSILIPTLPARKKMFDKLIRHIYQQKEEFASKHGYYPNFDIVVDDMVQPTIGTKRNALLGHADGDYICFIDDDDRIADNYLELVYFGIKAGPDCCSLNGIITTNGANPKPFKHSIDYDRMYEEDGVYYRPPNHLNTVKSSIAKQMKFPDWQYSEDSNYCFQLQASGLLKKEYKIEPVIYFYDYITDKRRHVYE